MVTAKTVQIRAQIGHLGQNRAKPALAMIPAMFVSAASAQQGQMPDEIAGNLLELGRVVDPPKTALFYAPLQERSPIRASESSAM
jgi:hypothetical protein